MKVKELAVKEFAGEKGQTSRCYLCEIGLREYVEALKPSFDEYKIQRGIVNNPYLDGMVNTFLNREHIPPITLVLDKDSKITFNKDSKLVEIPDASFEILDGLQRTARLKTIFATVELISQNPEILNNGNISYDFKRQLFEIGSNSRIADAIIKNANGCLDNIYKIIDSSTLWLEIWEGLNEEDTIQKMLLLNAGHKQVKIRHQLEILFFGLQNHIEEKVGKEIELIKEKDNVSIVAFSKNRKTGQFKVADIILGYIAFKTKEFKVKSSKILDSNLKLQDGDTLESEFQIKYEEVIEYIQFLLAADICISREYDNGRVWFAKETVIVGLSAAVGEIVVDKKISCVEVAKTLEKNIKLLKLEEYEKFKNSIQTSKVNIGDVTKEAVYNAILQLLEGKTIDWASAFKDI